MKSYEEMVNDVHRRINEYEVNKALKRSRMTKVAASALPVLAAAGICFGLSRNSAIIPDDKGLGGNNIYPAVSEAEKKAFSPETTKSAPDSKNEHNDISDSTENEITSTKQAEPSQEPENPTENATQTREPSAQPNESAAVQPVTSGSKTPEKADKPSPTEATAPVQPSTSAEIPAVKPTEPVTEQTPVETPTEEPALTYPALYSTTEWMSSDGTPCQPSYDDLVSSYRDYTIYCYAAPDTGSFFCSVPLTKAMEENKDTKRYLINVDMFRNNSAIQNYQDIEQEEVRLYQLGYTAGIEMIYNQGDPYYRLILIATYDQINNFPVRDDTGYCLRLSGEIG